MELRIIIFLLGAVAGVIALAAWIRGGILFGHLVDREYLEHHEQWISDGGPIGFWYSRREATFLRSALASGRVRYQWFFDGAEWITRDSLASALHEKWRRSWVVAGSAALLTAAAFIFADLRGFI